MTTRWIFLASAGGAIAWAPPLFAQDRATPAQATDVQRPAAVQPASDAGEEDEEIVVTGQRPRGSVIGDIPAESTLSPQDIRATGATSVTELLAALAPQTGSARGRGGGPVLLLNGQRISGFGEVRDLPPEAIARVEILPEEVALKYGYSADQRVVNIVLRQRFQATTVRGEAATATAGGYASGETDLSRLMIRNSGRTNLTLHAEGNDSLTESERNLLLQPLATQPTTIDPRPYRSLVGSQKLVRASGTANRTVLGNVSATLNAEATHSEGSQWLGVPTGALAIPVASPFAGEGASVLRGFTTLGPLTRDTRGDTAHLGLTLNGSTKPWRYSVVGTADVARNVTTTDQGLDLRVIQSRINAGDPTLDPLSNLPPLGFSARDRARSTRKSAGIDGTLSGPLATLPAGRANVTLKTGADTLRFDSFANRAGIVSGAHLGRDHVTASANVDVPIARRNGPLKAIGQLTLNANAQLEHFSDFGTLKTIGAGANWSPLPRLNLITSWSREEEAPSINNLGDPVLVTPNVRVFDYVTGTTVLVNATTGGNPALRSDTRRVWKLGANWQPWEKTDLRLRADYVRTHTANPVQSLSGPTATLQAAFPNRFPRDALGNLTAVDFRPVNYASARTDTIRFGFDFSKPLKSAAPSQALIDQLRRARQQAGGAPGGPDGGPPPSGSGGGGFGGRRGGGGGFFGGPGGNQRGRIQFSLTDTLTLVDKALIQPGIAELDYLNGAPSGGGSAGGTPRHLVQAQAGYSNNGYGARLSANYRSGTRVTGGRNGDLGFAPLATFDLRLFANLGDNLAQIVKHPWMRGLSIQLNATNIFDGRQRVTDRTGAVPPSYQPDLIDPIGRTIGITIRKLFIPARFFQRPAGGRARQDRPPNAG